MNDFSLIDQQKFVKRAEVVDSKSFIYYYKHMFSVQTIVWGEDVFEGDKEEVYHCLYWWNEC